MKMTDSGEVSDVLNAQNGGCAECTNRIHIDNVSHFLELCNLQSQYSPPMIHRSEYDIGWNPEVDQDLRKQVVSIDQFKSSVKRGIALLAFIEERLHEACSRSDAPKDDGAWKELKNAMSEASNEIFVANRVYEKLRNSGSNSILSLYGMRTEVNEKWFSVRKLFDNCEEKSDSCSHQITF